MSPLTSRRGLLRDGLFSVGTNLVVPGIFTDLAAHMLNPAIASVSDRVLIVVHLAGGLDGVHAVVPYKNDLYYHRRPTIGVPANSVIPLTDQLGLHPTLAPLKSLWDSGEMTIIENVGYPITNLSHFISMYIWQTLDMSGNQGTVRTGWLGRYLEQTIGQTYSPFTALCDGLGIATALESERFDATAIADPTLFAMQSDAASPERLAERNDLLISMYDSYSGVGELSMNLLPKLTDTTKAIVNAAGTFSHAYSSYKPAVQYPQTGLGTGLRMLATALADNLDMKVGVATHFGYDNHSNEAAGLNPVLQDLAQCIGAFWQDLKMHGTDQKVLMLIWSEFGRRVEENGSAGTDHGVGVPLFLFGPGVKGGIVGGPPDLEKLDATGNLVYTNDFRSVYASILHGWWGANPAKVLGADYPRLDFLKTGK